uniref:Uncharacterized protein n=1 Tax=Ditylenchus dipsaci TaxID=166011 RepID=A0A915DAT4_9BILA
MGIYSTTDPASIPPVENNFSANFFDWNYPSYYGVYCTGGNTIPGQKNYLIGAIYFVAVLKRVQNEPITRIIPFSNGFQVATNQHKVMIHSNSSITNETVIVPSTGIFFLSPEANSTYVLGNLTLRPTLLPLINLKAEHYENLYASEFCFMY